jgi:hypothetical protein
MIENTSASGAAQPHRYSRSVWLTVFATVIMTKAVAEQAVPILTYQSPPNFSRSAIAPPVDYSSNDVNASFQVYPFRPINGNIQQMFGMTLLREWIDSRFQEQQVAGRPVFGTANIPGAQVAFTARFVESIAGAPRQRLRMVIVVGNAAAIVDAFAIGETAWQRAGPALNLMAASLRVTVEAETPDISVTSGLAGKALAGLYMARTRKDAVDPNQAVGSNMIRVPALYFYLFSANGRVYRAYDELLVPGSNANAFDFKAAKSADPVNSGHYTVKDGHLRIHMGDDSLETIVTKVPVAGRVKIGADTFERQ